MPLKLMMSAAEVSGDVHGAYLANELHNCILLGMGGERMRTAGVDIRLDITDKSSVGITEAFKFLPAQLSTFSKMKKMLLAERPDALILIDAQGFNMPLAAFAKKNGIKTIYYVAPQEWLWGTKKGIENEARTIDLIVSIFKKEHEANVSAGGNSVYYGHPLLDIVKPKLNKEEFFRKFNLDPHRKTIALCPGSRRQELDKLLPILLETAKLLGDNQYLMPLSSSKYKENVQRNIERSGVNVRLIDGFNYDVLKHSDLAISKSGTIILECVLLGTPVIMFYKLSRLTYFIAKNFLKVNLPYYSMPNLLAGKNVVKELVMQDATAEKLSIEAQMTLKDPSTATKSYPLVMEQLGEPGAIARAAQKIIEFAGSR